MQNFQINILDEGLPTGVSGFQRGVGTPAIKEFNLMLTFFNNLEPMHPTLPTAEIDIVVKSFDISIGIKFVRDLL